MIGFTFAPRGWAYCDGQILAIGQNQALFSILGVNYGGNGTTTFGLPDLRGRTPIHSDQTYSLAARSGFETVTLTSAEIPLHSHAVRASSLAGVQPAAQSALLGAAAIYRDPEPATSTAMRPGTISNAGGSQPHSNMQPYLTLGFVIALQGVFPSRN
ncbi:phage tail protein [Hoeflea marina]|nr:tail fiber protein [Hoeflea marina]